MIIMAMRGSSIRQPILQVEDLHATVAGKEVLKGVSLEIGEGEVHAFFGPNGSGKTTLLNTIMGFGNYKITEGHIFFRGREINDLPVNERASLGMGISFQRPPTIKGVKLRNLVEISSGVSGKEIDITAEMLNVTEFLDRDINDGLSGGEIKRAELLQLIMQDPSIVYLDEPESGVDLENISLIGKAINKLLGRKPASENDKTLKEKRLDRKAALVITHTGHILDYLEADKGHVLVDGKIVCGASPGDILHTVREYGYGECYRCLCEGGIYNDKE